MSFFTSFSFSFFLSSFSFFFFFRRLDSTGCFSFNVLRQLRVTYSHRSELFSPGRKKGFPPLARGTIVPLLFFHIGRSLRTLARNLLESHLHISYAAVKHPSLQPAFYSTPLPPRYTPLATLRPDVVLVVVVVVACHNLASTFSRVQSFHRSYIVKIRCRESQSDRLHALSLASPFPDVPPRRATILYPIRRQVTCVT